MVGPVDCHECGSRDVFLRRKGATQIGLYCDGCGKWHKWVGKKDVQEYKRRGNPVHPEHYVPSHMIMTPPSPPRVEQPETTPTTRPAVDVDDFPFGEPFNPQTASKDVVVPSLESIMSHDEEPEEKEEREPCPVCASGNLDLLSDSDDCKASFYNGVLTITSKDNTKLYGAYRINYCLNCGARVV